MSIPIGEASYPVPFAPGLEFNPPVHGTWNIVHIGMNMPEAVQIYVCAINCMRGVVLTAAEMNCQDRFSCVILEERDILEGKVEEITIEGVTDVLKRREKLPPVVLLFTVCTHHFLGCNLNRIYRTLEERFPDVVFARCFMDPIMQKKGLTPDQKLRRAMGELLLDTKESGQAACNKQVSVLGCDFPLDLECEMREIFEREGISMKEIMDCDTFAEYRSMGQASYFVCTYPPGVVGMQLAAKRMGKKFLYLPSCFGYEEIQEEWKQIYQEICGWDLKERETEFTNKITKEIEACETALLEAKQKIGDTPIYIDVSIHPRPLGLARMLLEHEFCVRRVYLDGISKEEEKDFLWLKEHAKDLELFPIIQTEGRVSIRKSPEKILAIGQKAAWYAGTPYFVNLVQGAGLWGFSGIRHMASLIEDAYQYEKDTRDLVPRKGLGCESCV